MYLLPLLALLFLHADAYITTVFYGSEPTCYHHQVGGGAVNDATLNSDITRELQGGSFACGDRVSFLWVAKTDNDFPAGTHSGAWELSFLGASTAAGKTGVGFGYVAGLVGAEAYDGIGETYLNYDDERVVNGAGGLAQGETQCTPTFGRGPLGFDTHAITSGNEKASIVYQEVTGAPLFNPKSVLRVKLQIDGIEKGEVIPTRIDIVIMCNGQPAGGVLQGDLQKTFFDGVEVNSGGGAQTVPMKSIEGVKICTGFGTHCELPSANGYQNFCADLSVSGTGFQNGGVQTGKVWYDWASGTFQYYLGASAAEGSWSQYNYDTDCTSSQASQTSYKYSSCGCEPVLQFPTTQQPQLFFAGNQSQLPSPCDIPDVSLGGSVQYWQLSSVSGNTRVYTVIGNQAFPYGPTRLVITNGVQSEITWLDGTVWKLSNVQTSVTTATCFGSTNAGLPTTCTSAPVCGRPLDIALMIERSENTDSIKITNAISFAGQFVNSFTFGPTAVQMAVYSFNQTAERYVGLNPSKTVVYNAVGRIGVGTGSQPTNFLDSLKTVVNTEFLPGTNLRANAQKVIVVVINNFDDSASAIANYIASLPVDSNGWPYIQIIAVPYATLNLQTELFALVTSGDSQNLFQIFDDCSNARSCTNLAASWNVGRVAARVCGLAQPSALCGGCCGVCDTSCVAEPCAGVSTCNPSPRCGERYVVNAEGCCVVEYITDFGCNTAVNPATCTFEDCDATNRTCVTAGGCSQTGLAPCRVSVCVNGACDVRDHSSISNCASIGTCQACLCNTATNQYEVISISSTCTDSTCATASCVNNNCVVGGTTPDPNPSWKNDCNNRICDPSTGWINQSVTCSPRNCFDVTCLASGGCTYTAVQCNRVDVCDISVCDPNTGSCPSPPTLRTCSPPAGLTTEQQQCYTCSCTAPAGCGCVESQFSRDNFASLTCCLYPALCVTEPPTAAPTVAPSPPPGVPTAPPSPAAEVCPATCVSDRCTTRSCPPGTSTCQSIPVDCAAIVEQTGNKCLRSVGCEPNGAGCLIEEIKCDQTPDNCTRLTANTAVEGCCVKEPVQCPSDPCNQGSCNVATNECVLTSTCVSPNPCFESVCTATGCELQEKCVSAIGGCSYVQCNAGVCSNTTVVGSCGSPDPCVVGTCTDVGGAQKCVFSPRCAPSDDGCFPNVCVVDPTDSTKATCQVQPLDCPSSNGCVEGGCLNGACYEIAQDAPCADREPCFIGSCELATGNCSYVPLNCSDPANWGEGINGSTFCSPIECDPLSPNAPCQPRSLDCTTVPGFQIENDTCDTVSCDDGNVTTGRQPGCVLDEADCFNFGALIAGLAGGAIAGIVLAAAFVAFLTCSGAAGAYALTNADPDDVPLSQNPLYAPNGHAGSNPMHAPEAGAGGHN